MTSSNWPTRRGAAAIGLTLLMALLLPQFTPGRVTHALRVATSPMQWTAAGVLSVLAVVGCVWALRSSRRADRVCGAAAAILVVWLIYAFVQYNR